MLVLDLCNMRKYGNNYKVIVCLILMEVIMMKNMAIESIIPLVRTSVIIVISIATRMMIKMIHMLFAAHVGCFLVMGDPIYHLHYSIVHHLNSESCRERRVPNCEMCHIRLD